VFLAVLVYAGIVACAIWSAGFFSRYFGITAPEGRIGAIDGLRGFLALGVFAHHHALWQDVFQGGRWDWGVWLSHFEHQLGNVGVAFFFMITAFLFTRKVVFAAEVNWGALYLGRIFRIYPLYLFVLILIVPMALALSGEMRGGIEDVLLELGHWLIFYQVPVNDYGPTYQLVAGVVWTLGHEMVFYLCLPVIALVSGRRVPLWTLILPPLAAVYVWYFDVPLRPFSGFLFGVLAARLVELPQVRRLAAHPLADVAALVSILVALFLPTTFWVFPVGIAFSLIAAGTSLWGFLVRPMTRVLGEVTYSMYLLHGLMLAALFHFVLGLERSASIPPGFYELKALPLTFVLVGLSFWCFRHIEQPGIALSRRLLLRKPAGAVLP
jgi:peptidoglycan/LPS O-acetylase OafA/YrhL